MEFRGRSSNRSRSRTEDAEEVSGTVRHGQSSTSPPSRDCFGKRRADVQPTRGAAQTGSRGGIGRSWRRVVNHGPGGRSNGLGKTEPSRHPGRDCCGGESGVGPITRFDTKDQGVQLRGQRGSGLVERALRACRPAATRKVRDLVLRCGRCSRADESLARRGASTRQREPRPRRRGASARIHRHRESAASTGHRGATPRVIERGPRRREAPTLSSPRFMANAVKRPGLDPHGSWGGTSFTHVEGGVRFGPGHSMGMGHWSAACSSAKTADPRQYRAAPSRRRRRMSGWGGASTTLKGAFRRANDDPGGRLASVSTRNRDGFVMGEGCGIPRVRGVRTGPRSAARRSMPRQGLRL